VEVGVFFRFSAYLVRTFCSLATYRWSINLGSLGATRSCSSSAVLLNMLFLMCLGKLVRPCKISYAVWPSRCLLHTFHILDVEFRAFRRSYLVKTCGFGLTNKKKQIYIYIMHSCITPICALIRFQLHTCPSGHGVLHLSMGRRTT
jgi:hypothetical protein